MRRIIILAAAMSIAACHSSNDEQTQPAPETDRNAPATHAIDTTRTGPPGTGGRTGEGTVTMDSVTSDSAAMTDTTTMTNPAPTAPPQDTLGPRSIDTTSATGIDTTGMGGRTADTAVTDTSGYR